MASLGERADCIHPDADGCTQFVVIINGRQIFVVDSAIYACGCVWLTLIAGRIRLAHQTNSVMVVPTHGCLIISSHQTQVETKQCFGEVLEGPIVEVSAQYVVTICDYMLSDVLLQTNEPITAQSICHCTLSWVMHLPAHCSQEILPL